MEMQEKEIKVLLSQEEYKRVEQAFQWDECFEQTNHYYGDPSEWEKSESCIRIREKKGKRKLQIKLPVENKDSLHIKMEYETEIECVKKTLDKNLLHELCQRQFERDCIYLGYLTTERKVCKNFEGVEVCLDKNIYLDRTDYEVEIEFVGEYPNDVVDILHNLALDTSRYSKGKFKRFIECKSYDKKENYE